MSCCAGHCSGADVACSSNARWCKCKLRGLTLLNIQTCAFAASHWHTSHQPPRATSASERRPPAEADSQYCEGNICMEGALTLWPSFQTSSGSCDFTAIPRAASSCKITGWPHLLHILQRHHLLMPCVRPPPLWVPPVACKPRRQAVSGQQESDGQQAASGLLILYSLHKANPAQSCLHAACSCLCFVHDRVACMLSTTRDAMTACRTTAQAAERMCQA